MDGWLTEAAATRCPTCGLRSVGYAVSAEFYDVLHGAAYRQQAAALADPAAAARVGIVELGAGTGLVTELLARVATVPVHVVEPAATMRAVLLSRLAADGEAGRRVTVHACCAQEIDLEEEADLAICLRVIPCLEPAERRAVWQRLAAVLVPDGVLYLDRPPSRVPGAPLHYWLPETRIGLDTYTAQLSEHPDGERIRCDYEYLVLRDGKVIRRAEESFYLWPLPIEELADELAEADLHLVDGPTHDLLRVKLTRSPRPVLTL